MAQRHEIVNFSDDDGRRHAAPQGRDRRCRGAVAGGSRAAAVDIAKAAARHAAGGRRCCCRGGIAGRQGTVAVQSLGGDRRRCHSVQLAFSKRCLKAQIISLLSASDANKMHGCNALYDAEVSAQCFKSSVHELKRSSPCPI